MWRCPLAFGISQIRRSCWDCWDASLLVVPRANSCCLVCHLPFGKPRELLVGENLQTAVEKCRLASASQRNLLFFFSFSGFLSHRRGNIWEFHTVLQVWDGFCLVEHSQGNRSAWVDDGAGVGEDPAFGPVILRLCQLKSQAHKSRPSVRPCCCLSLGGFTSVKPLGRGRALHVCPRAAHGLNWPIDMQQRGQFFSPF